MRAGRARRRYTRWYSVGLRVWIEPCPPCSEEAWITEAPHRGRVGITFTPGSNSTEEFVQEREVTPWSSTYPTIRSTTRPAALLFLHVEKTGGTAVRNWLERQSKGRQGRLQLVGPECFASLLHGGRGASCDLPPPLPLNSSVTAVEYHGQKRDFWTHMHASREHYRDTWGGRLLSATLVRDPLSHLLSVYRYWPPPARGGGTEPLHSWLGGATSFQTLAIARGISADRAHGRDGVCSRLTQEAAERLSEVDVAAPMECLAAFLALVEEGLGLAHQPAVQPAHAQAAAARARDRGSWNETLLRVPSVRAAAEAAAACDRSLYESAVATFCARHHGRVPTWARCELCDKLGV